MPDLLKFICERFWVNKDEAAEYLELLPKEELISELKRYGNDDGTIKKLLKQAKMTKNQRCEPHNPYKLISREFIDARISNYISKAIYQDLT
jgi:hypothetical protein